MRDRERYEGEMKEGRDGDRRKVRGWKRILRAGDGVEKVSEFTPDFPVSCLCPDLDVLTTDWVVCTGLRQWWKVTKHIYSRTVLKYNFEVLVHYLSISIFCYFILLLIGKLYFLLHIYLITLLTRYFGD